MIFDGIEIVYEEGEWVAYDDKDGECRPATPYELMECGIYD